MDLACIMKIFEITKIAMRDIEWIFSKEWTFRMLMRN